MISYEVVYGSVRPCDECGKFVPFSNPDAEYRVCNECVKRINDEIDIGVGLEI